MPKLKYYIAPMGNGLLGVGVYDKDKKQVRQRTVRKDIIYIYELEDFIKHELDN